jgi:hypothetical protein
MPAKSRRYFSFTSSFAAATALAALALLLLIPAARSESTSVVWAAPTPADHARFSVKAGKRVTFQLVASTTVAGAIVHIEAKGLPLGVVYNSSDGTAARAKFDWVPDVGGNFTIQFSASTTDTTGVKVTAPTRTYFVHVTAPAPKAPPPPAPPKIKYPRSYTLTDDKVAHWAFVLAPAAVRAQPRPSAKPVTRLETGTSDGTQNLVLVLDGRDLGPGNTWYHVRLPILPNNTTGWVRAGYLSELNTVHTHLYVDRVHFTATLKRDGVTVFKTIVGVGKSFWPTPRGEFYVRDKLTNFGDPFYGPIAFGTSARSAVLTDWPGGGYVGLHGTNQPQILPGQVSHGCIRMPNPSIVKLARLMAVGTPLTIR